MTTVNGTGAVIPVPNLNAYFQQALQSTSRSQRLDTDDSTLAYLTHLLTDYARSERLYDHTEDGMIRRPLVDIYRQASEAETTAERELALQRLGDLALFVSGFLPHSLQRSLVDVDYYVAMGSAAYGNLSDSISPGTRVRALRSVFVQLSRRFIDFVDLIAETIEHGNQIRNPDLMRLHDLWLKTGSRRLARQLVECGVIAEPTAAVH
jgi:hypothetical protein